MSDNIIQAEGLSKYYGDRIALRGASFAIAKGECVGFLGRNGAGKSTLLKILATALLPSAGTVKIGGRDAVNDPDAARRLLGFLPEEPPLYPEMTVRAYLTFLAKLRGVSNDNVATRVAEVASRTSLNDVLDDAIGTLSLGFRKRVGIAQAIVHEPAVVIVDEPISGSTPRRSSRSAI
jgi:ABC-2 type transport system ATP-binding protein